MINRDNQPKSNHAVILAETLSTKKNSRCVVYLQKGVKYLQKTISATDEMQTYLKDLLLDTFSFKQIRLASSKGYLIITRPYHQKIDYLQTIKKTDCLGTLLQRLILQLMQASNRRFYTYDNIFVDYSQQVSLNQSSFAGVLALAQQEDFQAGEFRQIYQLLTVQLLQDRKGSKLVIPWQIKLRSIGMMIFYALFGKKISLIPKEYLNRQIITRKEAILLVEQLRQYVQALLSNLHIRSTIVAAEQKDGISYGKFLEQVFINDCMNMSWERTLEYLVPAYMQNRVYNSAASTTIQQMNSQIDCSMLMREQMDYYFDHLASKSKLKQLGITKQIYLYLQLQIPSFTISISQFILSEDLQMNMHVFSSFSQIINSNQEMRTHEYKAQSCEVITCSAETIQTQETEAGDNIHKIERSKEESFDCITENNQGQQYMQVVRNQPRISPPQSESQLQGYQESESNYYIKDLQPAKQFPFALLSLMGKQLLAVPLAFNEKSIKGINNRIKMLNKYLKI